jgi:hypothetical protein
MCASNYGQSTADDAARSIELGSIPFVGCPSFGMLEVSEAPKGTDELVRISEQDGLALAYYKSADGIGVLAPRGWYCQGASGSGGAALFVGPRPIIHNSSGWEGLGGAVIEVNDISGENSGRYEIAELIARVFPAYRSFALRVGNFDSPLPSGPYPKDSLTGKKRPSDSRSCNSPYGPASSRCRHPASGASLRPSSS